MSALHTKTESSTGANNLASWSAHAVDAFERELSLIPVDRAGINSVIAEKLEGLTKKLAEIKEFERWDPRNFNSVVQKKNYKVVDELRGHTSAVSCLRYLPNGHILSGSADHTIRLWSKDTDGIWRNEVIASHDLTIQCLEVIPNGEIISASGTTIYKESRNLRGEWQSEVLCRRDTRVACIRVFPNGSIVAGYLGSCPCVLRKDASGIWQNEAISDPGHFGASVQTFLKDSIVSGSPSGKIFIESKDDHNYWQCETLSGHQGWILSLHALPNGSLVSSGNDQTIRVWKKDSNGEWKSEAFEHSALCMQVLSDGRIVTGTESDGINIISNKVTGITRNHNFVSNLFRKLLRGLNNRFHPAWLCEKLDCQNNLIQCLQVLPDGRIISGGHDKIIRIWDGEPTDRHYG